MGIRRILPLLSVAALLVGCEQSGEAVSSRPDRPGSEPAEVAPPAKSPQAPAAAPADVAINPDAAPPDEPSAESPVDESDYVEPQPPPAPVAPADYGQIKPKRPLPDEAELVKHALAGWEVVAVYTEPSLEAEKVGWLRLGARFETTEKIDGEGCPRGWYALPQGGFACASKGFKVDKKPPYYQPAPPPPNMEGPLPYEYAKVRKWNTPHFWRVPTKQEQEAAAEKRAMLEAQREGKPLPEKKEPAKPAVAKPAPAPEAKAEPAAAKKPATKADALPSVKDEPKKLPSVDDAAKKDDAKAEQKKAEREKAEPKKAEPEKAEPEKAEPKEDAPPTVVAAAEPEPEPEPPVVVPFSPDDPWLEQGFYVSLAGKLTEEGKTWWRTARNGYLPAGNAYKHSPKDFQGVELGEDSDFPLGFAMAKEPRLNELTDDGKLKFAKKVERRTFLDLTDETEINGRTYMMTTEGLLIRKDHVRFVEPQPIPEGVQPWERWIDVSLDKQILVAYEGDRPVFVTLISSGRKGTPEESFETPTGRWRIRAKHVSTTMDGPTATDGNYSIQDVPWTMYFHESYALHGAFWHDGFGRVRSHGCVNLGPSDARWLFNWTTPFLPEGWHGVFAHDGSPGTTVVVRR